MAKSVASGDTYTLDGVRVPSVTQIMGACGLGLPPPGAPPERIEAARQRGMRVHALCAAPVQDTAPPQWADEDTPYVEAFGDFLATMAPTEAVSEQPIGSGFLHYAGTPDLVARIRDDLWVIDIKATYELHQDVDVQCAAYGLLVKCTSGLRTVRIGALHLTPQRKPAWRLEEYDYDTAVQDWYACIRLYRRLNGR